MLSFCCESARTSAMFAPANSTKVIRNKFHRLEIAVNPPHLAETAKSPLNCGRAEQLDFALFSGYSPIFQGS